MGGAKINFWVFLGKHWGKITGGILGLITALLVLSYGWGTLLIFAFIALGVFIGWRLEFDESIRKFFERLFSSRGDF